MTSLREWQALFRQNGRCGYVLKPMCLLPGGRHDTPALLRVTLLGAQHLPHPADAGGIASPYCVVTVHGVRASVCMDVPLCVVCLRGCGERRRVSICRRWQDPADAASRRSRTVANNGFAPQWPPEVFEFRLEYPSLAILHIQVMHQVRGACACAVRYPCVERAVRSS